MEVDSATTLNARQLGRPATTRYLQKMLVDQLQSTGFFDAILAHEPLSSAGVGLSTLERMELLAATEERFGQKVRGLYSWIDESPTFDGMARYLIDNTPVDISQ